MSGEMEKADEFVDPGEIEVGRHALRTFRFYPGATSIDPMTGYVTRRSGLRLRSLYQDTYWEDGKMVAECRKDRRSFTIWASDEMGPTPCKEAPSLDCRCGLYGAVSADSLMTQYFLHARKTIAVMAAEGPTIIGTKGLRTSAARIVAYWVSEDQYVEAYSTCDMATRYTDRSKMLSDFGFEDYDFSKDPEHVYNVPCWCGDVHYQMPGITLAASSYIQHVQSETDRMIKAQQDIEKAKAKMKALQEQAAARKVALESKVDQIRAKKTTPPPPGTETPRWWGRKKS